MVKFTRWTYFLGQIYKLVVHFLGGIFIYFQFEGNKIISHQR